MELFEVGALYYPVTRKPHPEGVEFACREETFRLVFNRENFGLKELADLRGECEFGAYVEDGNPLLLVSFREEFVG